MPFLDKRGWKSSLFLSLSTSLFFSPWIRDRNTANSRLLFYFSGAKLVQQRVRARMSQKYKGRWHIPPFCETSYFTSLSLFVNGTSFVPVRGSGIECKNVDNKKEWRSKNNTVSRSTLFAVYLCSVLPIFYNWQKYEVNRDRIFQYQY